MFDFPGPFRPVMALNKRAHVIFFSNRVRLEAFEDEFLDAQS